MNRHSGNGSGCLGDHRGCVVEGVDCLWTSSDSLDHCGGSVVESVNSCWRGSHSLYDSWSSGVVNCMDDTWGSVM